jgi:hypothetical protein
MEAFCLYGNLSLGNVSSWEKFQNTLAEDFHPCCRSTKTQLITNHCLGYKTSNLPLNICLNMFQFWTAVMLILEIEILHEPH